MTTALRTYLLSIVAISLFSSILLTLHPRGTAQRALRLLCGLSIILVTLGPVATLDVDAFARALSRSQILAEEHVSETEINNRELMAELIKEKAETYILDKAARLGLSPAVCVAVDMESEYPYPYSAEITVVCTKAAREQLTRDIAQNLAIPSERQEWNTYENG